MMTDLYIERSDKETEEFIAEESSAFLEASISYLKEHKNEFIYFETSELTALGVDSLSIEVDDVFATYDVMLGLKLAKKQSSAIRTFLDQELNGNDIKYDLMFDQGDGLWNVNFTLDYVSGFRAEMTLANALRLIIDFLTRLVKFVKE
ncbi:branched-chain amino acid aminotransferase [Robertmurraya sp. DFI.2.37]|uniref:branched-chain amino acid aminotransferase n=1 Tax=Robertmurraya sp. DFI.2.37 TaxID=3031819 RepID=UPI0023DA783B|nr:branched-chain amino acid aminotransferase [Robertmurraya sp. DFI.2.37]MDF1510329.1 branched-chain amino acid aminotransferase [Robertmurraya sp. DFI.2.37]